MKTIARILKRLLMIVVAIGVGYGGWLAYQRLVPEEQTQGLGEVPTQEAEVRDVTVSVSATGTLRPVRIVQVKSKAAGEILNMPVELGDRVHSGDLLAQIDTQTLEQELNQANADLDSARVRLEVAEKQYRRAQELQAQDLVSEQDLDNAQQSFTTARGALLRAEAELRLRQERLDDATVRAPINGTVIKKNVEEGTIIQSSVNSVQGGTTLLEMADLTTLEVRTLVDEIDIGRVRPGLPVEITVEAYPERRFRGAVIKIEPQAVITQQVTTFPVLSDIDNSEGLLLPGMNADVEIIIHRRDRVLTVPNEAVKTLSDASRVAELLGVAFDRQALSTRAASAGAGERREPGAALAAEPGGQDRPGVDGHVAGDGDQEAKAAESGKDTGEIDFSKLRSMSQEERRKFFANMTDEQRRKLRERFAGARRGGGGPSGGFDGGDRSGPGNGRGGSNAPAGAEGGNATAARPAVSMDAFGLNRAPVPGVVFVLDDAGQMVPRRVMVGIKDWEHTEVISGLRAGERVVLLPSTSLLMSQQALRERFSRFSRLPGTGRRR